MDESVNFAAQLGELRGRFDALERKVDDNAAAHDRKIDGVAADVKWLRSREAERTGGEKADQRSEIRGAHREMVRVGLVGGGIGAGVATLAQALLRKLGVTL